jgi:two-component system, LytTR family, response regulator LytT
MNIRCIAIDDEPLALKKLSGYISKTPFLENVGAFASAFSAFDLISKSGVDLMFIDIDMPDINGLDFVRTLREKPQVIFTTAFSEYAFEGFKVDALDYLLKPIGYNDFLKSANKARLYFDSLRTGNPEPEKKKEFLFIKADHKINKISLKEIVYIEGMREYVRIHLSSGKSLMPLYSMKALGDQLPSDTFMRIHKSYIVNLEKIVTVENNRIVFEEKVYIPVSDQYREQFYGWLNSHSL